MSVNVRLFWKTIDRLRYPTFRKDVEFLSKLKMASPDDVRQFIQKQMLLASQKQGYYYKIVRKQRQKEKRIIQSTSSLCPLTELEGRVIDPEKFRSLINASDDGNIFKAILCLNNAKAILPSKSGKSIRIRRYLQNLRQIGGESADGVAMTADVGGDAPLFVVKSPKRQESQENSLLHEYFIGVYGTNQLKSIIPTFVYVFGTFTCSPPYIDNYAYLGDNKPLSPDEDRTALTYCQNDDNQVNYVMYENVPGISLQVFVQTCSPEEYLSIIIQILIALHIANQTVQFGHNDLHDQNVLVVELPEAISIRYKDIYLETKYVAKIIDFGRSHIVYEGEHFGYDMVEYGVYPDRANPMADLYKLIMFSLTSMAYGFYNPNNKQHVPDRQLEHSLKNPKTFSVVKEIISYWYPNIPRLEDLLQPQEIRSATGYLTDTRGFYYSLPDQPFSAISPMDFYRDFLVPKFGPILVKFISKTPMNRIYGCFNRKSCSNLSSDIKNFSIDEYQLMADPYVFYDLIPLITEKPALDDVAEYLLPGFIERLNEDVRLINEEVAYLTPRITLVSFIAGGNDISRWDDLFLDQYRRFVDRMARMSDLIRTLNDIGEVLQAIVQIFRLDNYKIYLPTDYLLLYNTYINSIYQDVEWITSLNKDKVLQANPNAKWIFNKLPEFVSAVNLRFIAS